MASRRPPLFELLQQANGPQRDRGSGSTRPGVLGGKAAVEEPQPGPANGQAKPTGNGQGATQNGGHAAGAVETKPLPTENGPPIEGLDGAPPKAKGKPALRPQQTDRPHPASPAPELKATPAPSSEKDSEDRPAGAADWSGMHPGSAVKVPMLWVYCGVAAVIAIVAGVWVVGYQLGVSSERDKVEQFLGGADQRSPIVDPMADGDAAQPGTDTSPLAGLEQPVEPEVEQQAERQPARQPVVDPEPIRVAPEIDVLVDVREAGHNYMKLASFMSRERATGLAEYLVANGVPAMALDEGSRGFGLYTAFAVPSERFSDMSAERDQHERRVYNLLDRVPRESGGPYDGRGRLWMRFDG